MLLRTTTKPPTPPADTAPSLILAFQGLDPSGQMAFLNDLVLHCTTPQLAHLTNIIAPRLKRDFLRDLPLELAHHILSMIDEPKSLVRVSLVSKFWHQLVETEDWIWRAQCIRQFGPTSCSSLPSPRAHLVPPTSYLYTTSPTSLDAVSSTLKSLSLNNYSNSSGSTSSSPASHRLSLGPGSMGSSAASSAHPSPASMKPGDLSLLAAATTTPTSPSSVVTGSSSSSSNSTISTTTSTVLSSMLLANQSSLASPGTSGHSGSSSANHSRGASPVSTVAGLRTSMPSRLALTSLTPQSPSTPTATTGSLTSSLSFSPGLALSALSSLDNQSAILTTPLMTDDDSLKQEQQQQQQQQRAQQQELQELQEQRQLQQQQYARQLKMATSYKAYFKRRFMIDRNWISGHHSLISYTTPETGVVTSLQFDHHHIVVGCDNSRIQIFETTSGRLIRTLQGHLGGVWALEFVKGVGSTGEKMLVSGGCDR
ncbi:hypothetical protein BGZ90_000274 [Linnemannia elongata]|nr:hypothetical protein BGZ90_000274 [Linnemannia elongata]